MKKRPTINVGLYIYGGAWATWTLDQRDVTGGYIITDMERLREPMNKITNYILEKISANP
jgi:hypothetical protein